MQAVVLVGGEGTRLRPLTYDIPKPMLPIVGRPIIARVVEWLALYGVTRAVLALGYRPDPFLEAFPEANWEGVEIVYSTEPAPLDTAGAIAYAADFAGISGERIVVLNGDVLTDLDLSKLLAYHEERGGVATIALTPVTDPSPYGVVSIDEDGRILEFVEKPPPGTAPSNLINAGTYIFEPEALDAIERGRPVSVERNILPGLASKGALYAVDSDTYWIDTGTPARYIAAQLDVVAGLRPNVILPECSPRGPGILEAPGATVRGDVQKNTFVGAHATIEAEAHVENAIISAAVRIGEGARVRNSVLLRDAFVERGARIEDSIVGPHSVIGASAAVIGCVVGANHTVREGAVVVDERRPY
ncbi:MAG: NDP-sugar synthase [Acidimicrobiales bacterium]